MTLIESLPLLMAEYWRQCETDTLGDTITARLHSAGRTDDHARLIVVRINQLGEWCYECRREQYGDWEPCSTPADRTDWELRT